MVNCVKCGTQNRDDTKYCKNCGAKLSANSVLTCGKCGASNQNSSLFCNRCGERLTVALASASKTLSKPSAKAAHGSPVSDRAKATIAVATKNNSSIETSKNQAPRAADKTKDAALSGFTEQLPDWLSRFYEAAPSQTRLIPTHDLLRMANALGIDVDYSTLRFWQKRGLVPRPTRGRVSSGRGTRGYYDPSLIDRLSFIREIQKLYAMNLDAIRDELDQIDEQFQSGKALSADPFKARLAELQMQRDLEARRTLATVLYKALGLEPGEIAAITIQKINGQSIEILPEKFLIAAESRV